MSEYSGFRQAFLRAVAAAQGRRFIGSGTALAADREASLAAWAAHLGAHLDLRWLPKAPAPLAPGRVGRQGSPATRPSRVHGRKAARR